VGLAAQTEDLIPNPQAKVTGKKLNLIAASDVREAIEGEGTQIVLLDSEGRVEELPELPKEEVAEWKADWVERRMQDGIQSNR